MRRLIVVLVAASWLSAVHAQDQDHSHHHSEMKASASTAAPIVITINPEVRVSVSRGGALPPAMVCGEAVELGVKIVNQGFLTAPLEASLVDSIPEGVTLEFSAEPLKGIPEEFRVLRVIVRKPGPADITVAFRARNDTSDLGGRDRIHFLLRCQAKQ